MVAQAVSHGWIILREASEKWGITAQVVNSSSGRIEAIVFYDICVFNIASLSFYVQLILKSVVIVSMSFIALFIGLAMKSSKATIISSFLLIFLTQTNIGDFTIKNYLVFSVILILISLVFAAFSIYNAETKDLI